MDRLSEDDPREEARLKAWLDQFTEELESISSPNLKEALPDFSEDNTLKKLQASIASDLISENPDVAIDRVHTYCVRRFRQLLEKRGQIFDKTPSLDALFGVYGKALRDEKAVSEYVLPMLRVQHKLFQSLNEARNKRSLAHDNELLDIHDAKFIIDSAISALSYIEHIERNK